MHRSLLALPLLATAVLVVPAFSGAASSKTVKLEDFKFKPATLKVSKGTKVTFRNLDVGTPHNVTSTGSKKFKSSKDFSKGSYGVTFKKAGSYAYTCTLHPLTMKGKVVVK